MAEEPTSFLNVDLDIVSRAPLEPLVEAFGKRVFTLHAGKERRRHVAHFELGTFHPRTADGIIRRFVALVKALPRARRKLWNDAQSRELNIGIQAGLAPHCFELRLEPATLAAAASVGARIVVTVYAAERPGT
jgi:hypothetical protein